MNCKLMVIILSGYTLDICDSYAAVSPPVRGPNEWIFSPTRQEYPFLQLSEIFRSRPPISAKVGKTDSKCAFLAVFVNKHASPNTATAAQVMSKWF